MATLFGLALELRNHVGRTFPDVVHALGGPKFWVEDDMARNQLITVVVLFFFLLVGFGGQLLVVLVQPFARSDAMDDGHGALVFVVLLVVVLVRVDYGHVLLEKHGAVVLDELESIHVVLLALGFVVVIIVIVVIVFALIRVMMIILFLVVMSMFFLVFFIVVVLVMMAMVVVIFLVLMSMFVLLMMFFVVFSFFS